MAVPDPKTSCFPGHLNTAMADAKVQPVSKRQACVPQDIGKLVWWRPNGEGVG